MLTEKDRKIRELNAAIRKMKADNRREFAVLKKRRKKKSIFEILFAKK